jgi:hypothetical protein
MITFLSVDIDGVLSWKSTFSPAYWFIEQCFEPGSSGQNGILISGNLESYNAYEHELPGGFYFRMWGLDEKHNLIIRPYISRNLSKNQ